MQGETLKNSVADTSPEEKVETLGDKIGDVNAKLIFETLPDNLRSAKAKINLHTLGNVSAKKRVDTMAETLQEAAARHVGRHKPHVGKTRWQTLYQSKSINTSRQIAKCEGRKASQGAG